METKRFFKPFIGDGYSSGINGQKVLVIGASFYCANPDCKSHEKYKNGFNADFNAARNIAMSTLFMETGEVTEKKKEEAREYYGIQK